MISSEYTFDFLAPVFNARLFEDASFSDESSVSVAGSLI